MISCVFHGPCLKGPPLSTYPGIINNYSGYPSHRKGMIKNHAEFKKKIEIIPPMKEVPWRVKEGRDQMITHYHTASTFQTSCLFSVVKCDSLIVTMFSTLLSTWRSWFLVLVSCLHCRYVNEARPCVFILPLFPLDLRIKLEIYIYIDIDKNKYLRIEDLRRGQDCCCQAHLMENLPKRLRGLEA